MAGKQGQSLGVELLVSGLSVGTATTFTSPLDVVKTRMQLAMAAGGPSLGLVSTTKSVLHHEGVGALWRGLTPAVARGLTYGGMRLGLYGPIKDLIQGDSHAKLTMSDKILAGSASGMLAAAFSSPLELVKTRLQAKGAVHSSPLAVVRDVVQREGVAGLWRGAVPGMVRASLLTASQCATYDEVKRWVMRTTGWHDHAGTQLACSMIAGLVTTTACNPADVVKTIMFVGGTKYAGPLAAAADVMRLEGPAGFFKGWTANYTRLGPQTVIIFLVAEHLRTLVGLPSL